MKVGGKVTGDLYRLKKYFDFSPPFVIVFSC